MTASTPNAQGVAVTVHNLHKRFGETLALAGINLDVTPGEVFVIMGSSGSGKTVLLKHIIGLETPDDGTIAINGHPVQAGATQTYRLAMVFQSGALLNSLTVKENVGLYLAEHRLRPQPEIDRIVIETLETLGLKGQEERFPADLSGGMRKRVAIARALVIEPNLLLYDEPTSELDPLMAATIGREILKLKNRIGLTSIVVTHDRSLAFGIADRLAIIHAGVIRRVGTPREIQNSSDPVIHRLINVDFTPNSPEQGHSHAQLT